MLFVATYMWWIDWSNGLREWPIFSILGHFSTRWHFLLKKRFMSLLLRAQNAYNSTGLVKTRHGIVFQIIRIPVVLQVI